ncbi:MAG: hypothetical protein RLZZ361_838 [Cyanobacteriota bacterium]|jgi:hypothetical protein
MNLEVISARDHIGLEDNSNPIGSSRKKSGNISRISRDNLSKLHRTAPVPDQVSQTPIAKGLQLIKSGLGNSLNSSLQIVSGSSGRFLDFANKNSQNHNLRSLLMIIVGSGFGLSFLRDLLKLPSYLISNKGSEKNAPTVLKIAKLVTGGTLGFGALNALMKGASFSHPAIIFGILVFLGFSSLINAYEDENSLPSKFLKLIGLREELKTSIDDLKTDQLAPN